MRDSTVLLGIRIQIDIHKSSCQFPYRKVLMAQISTCDFLKCGFLKASSYCTMQRCIKAFVLKTDRLLSISWNDVRLLSGIDLAKDVKSHEVTQVT